MIARNDLGLTLRETEVLRHCVTDGGNKQAAAALYLSVKTVEMHLVNIRLKLNMMHCPRKLPYLLGAYDSAGLAGVEALRAKGLL